MEMISLVFWKIGDTTIYFWNFLTFKNEKNCSILIFDQISGQEEYDEHHSEITQCRFSNSGATIASSDVDGVVKVSMDFSLKAGKY